MDILKEVENISEQLDELRKFVYENPELGFEEYKSSKAHRLIKKAWIWSWMSLHGLRNFL